MRPLDVSNGYQLSENRMDQLRAVINETFLANPYGSIQQTPVRSATEIAAREADLFQSTAAAFGRLQTEFLEKFMKRVIYILKSNGKIPDLKVDGKETTIKFTSPFAKMQGSEKVKNTLQWLGYIMPLGQEITGLAVNIDKVPANLAKNMGIDKELYNDATQVDANKEQIATMAQQAVQSGAVDPAQLAQGGGGQAPMPLM